MATDLEIREFASNIVNYVNKSPLPIEIKRLCLVETLGKLTEAADVAIRNQIEERKRESNEQSI